ncbi:LPS export ABC transporter periplasmic protein LptC [Parasulfitobacter algicola]|uniref:LPS export ABC transporter periplasmic protein LptC n=1 Tax=Parasulfitobacter algicola TaxID=2614809 RepID=A0ABX2IMY9_9RHOB|nr:LPS export ABC transporter periplasmic protein LptC [Sulfitobacter algicola]NSX53351.1 LPS export ABC transporter periplasmic protein LptC [Sulfitobacter algicola]
MATFDNAYSRFVVMAKVVLPLVALGILSTLFLFSKSKDAELTIPYAEVDVESIARDQIIGEPTYTGVTRDGSAISISALSARPRDGDTTYMLAEDLQAVITTPDGTIIDIEAIAGTVDSVGNQAILNGNVQIVTSTGYQINTPSLMSSLNDTDLSSDAGVQAKGPLGVLDAGGMHLTETAENGYLLVFNGGVKLVYTPQN